MSGPHIFYEAMMKLLGRNWIYAPFFEGTFQRVYIRIKALISNFIGKLTSNNIAFAERLSRQNLHIIDNLVSRSVTLTRSLQLAHTARDLAIPPGPKSLRSDLNPPPAFMNHGIQGVPAVGGNIALTDDEISDVLADVYVGNPGGHLPVARYLTDPPGVWTRIIRKFDINVLPASVSTYLDLHRWTGDTIVTVRSISFLHEDMDAFKMGMISFNMPSGEAEWVWRLIHDQTNALD